MKKNLLSIIIIIFFLFLLFFEIQCKSPSIVDSTGSHYLGLDSNAKYVGMSQCRQCHQSIYETFAKTGMGLSINHASRKKSSARFDKHALVYDKYSDYYYQPFWDHDSLHILEFRLKGKDTVYERSVTISYIVGSGQHTNSHIYNVNGYLYQAPMTYYTQNGNWDLPPGFENGNNSRFSRIIGLECLSCHNGYPEMDIGSENKYSMVPAGIDCERCHGPGSAHVSDKKAGKLIDVTKEIDYSIVNPAKLSIDLQFDVCQRCHIQGNAVLNEGKSFFDFRPGMKLSDVMNVFMPVYKGREEEHIMASHAERLKQSKCYLKTTEKISGDKELQLSIRPYESALTCISCHNPHVSRLATPKESFNNACKKCHDGANHNECTEKEIKLRQINFNCIFCHMPENKTVDIPHVRIHDHRIMIPISDTKKKKVKEFIGIVAINNPHPDRLSIARAYINYFEKFDYDTAFLDTALGYINKENAAEIDSNIRLIVHVYFLKKDYRSVSNYVNQCNDILLKSVKQSYDNEDAWTCYRIAESFYLTGYHAKAIIYYRQSYKLAPLDPKFCNEYAQHLAMEGQYREAIALFESIIKMQPLFAPSYCNLGYIYLSNGNNIEKANQLIEKALSLDPDYESALMNKAAICIIQKKNSEVIKILKQVLKLNPSNIKAKLVLKKIAST